MTGPFDLLGIASDADERAIKLAYAKLLKLTRPDDDPEGFQRLNQAYRQALGIAQSRRAGAALQHGQASGQPMATTLNLSANAAGDAVLRAPPTDEPAHAAPSRPPTVPVRPPPEPAAPRPQRPEFDTNAFLAEYRRVGAAGGAKALSRWLMDYPAFWHLPTKHAAGQWLLRTLYESPETMPESCLTATSEFFHYEDAIGGVDPIVLRRVATRLAAASLMKPEHVRDLAWHAFRNSQRSSLKTCTRAIRRLSRPFRWWRDLTHALRPSAAGKVAAVANVLCDGNPDDLPASIDRDHARFWMDACNPGKPRAQLRLAVVRSAAALVLVPLAWAALVWILLYRADPAGTPRAALTIWQGVTLVVGGFVALYWVPLGLRVLFNKADALAGRSMAFRLLMASFTPAMCALALTVAYVMDAALGIIIAIIGTFIAFWRMRMVHYLHTSSTLSVAALVCFATVIPTLVGTSRSDANPLLLPTVAVVLIALAFWAFDWFRRGFLRPHTPRTGRQSRQSRPA